MWHLSIMTDDVSQSKDEGRLLSISSAKDATKMS
jgi:hypothetical protein